MKTKPKHNFFGYAVFIVLSIGTYFIIKYKEFEAINDFFTSLLMLVFFVMAFFIFLANHGWVSHSRIINIIQKIPNYLPFKHTLKTYLLNLIQKKCKIIVLIRTLDKKNYEWVLNQISAYNSIVNNPALSKDELEDIEFFFVDNNQSDVKKLIEDLNLREYNYIIISGLSAIFKDAIMAREKLNSEDKKSIKIIGSLSSINSLEIQKIIDSNDNIIRIFPPDYDEAKTAMNFLFSKIKSSMCSNGECDFSKEKNNIIILHNGTYGQAVRDKCAYFFDKEFECLDINTANDFCINGIDDSIKFYSFDYKHNDMLIHDQSKTEGIEQFLPKWGEENVKNHFYIIGYEPNISLMLEYLDNALSKNSKIDFSLLFAGTVSMDSWKNRIVNTLSKSKNFNAVLPHKSYYLQLHTIHDANSIQHVHKLALDLYHYKVNQENDKADIEEELRVLLDKHETKITNMLSSYWKNENNYITTFTTDSLHIALYAIKHGSTLLESKSKVLQEYGRKTDILVNGDSINQYAIKMLNKNGL